MKNSGTDILDTMKWDEFSLEAYVVYQGIIKNQEELIHRGILTDKKFHIDTDYVLDITRMLKVVYNKNLKNFIRHSSGISLEDALASITNRLFLSSKLSEKSDKRRTYDLPDYSLFTIHNDKKDYVSQELNERLLDSVPDYVLEYLETKEYKNNFRIAEVDSYEVNGTLMIEKTRLSKPQLILMGFKKDLETITTLKDSRLKASNNLKKLKERELYNLEALELHKRAVYNYIAMVLQNGMIDYIKETYSGMSQEVSGVISNSQDDDDLRDYDRYFMVDDNSQDLIKEIELVEDIKKLSKKAYELQLESDEYKFEYNVESIEVVLQLSMYSFKPKEISKILDTPYSVISNIRELLKEAIFVSAMESNLGVVTDLESIDKYLEDMGGNLSEYKDSDTNVASLSIVDIQKQLKETMGREYYMIQEVREYLDSKI